MPSIALTNPIAGTVATAGLIAGNNNALVTLLNNGLDTANWATGKIFAPSKLTQEAALTGQAIVWNGTTGQWVPSGGYATTLPGSPFDGQEATLVDSITLPTYQWRFRWNAGSSNADKWEFIGGGQAEVTITTDESTASTTYVDLATAGPSFTLPRAGVYRVFVQANFYAAASAFMWASVKRGAAATTDTDAAVSGWTTTGTPGATVGRWLPVITGMSASDVLKVQYKTSASTAHFLNRSIFVQPVRVS